MKSQDELRELHKQEAIERLIRVQAEKAIKKSMTYITKYGDIVSIPPPSPKGFTGEGNRLSDYPFESDEERERERDESREAAQARHKAGLAPFEDDSNIKGINRLPWAKKDEEPSSPPSSGAKDPNANVGPDRIPTMFSKARPVVNIQAARTKYKDPVEWAIKNRRAEQPDLVAELEALWVSINEPMVEIKEVKQLESQLPQIKVLLDNIQKAHVQKLFGDLQTRMDQVRVIYETNYEVFEASKWESDYKEAQKSVGVFQKDSASHTDDNFDYYLESWREIQEAAQQLVPSAPTTTALKIGLNPLDASDMEEIYQYFVTTGGNALKGHVTTVCTSQGKAGGHYTYKGKVYDMWHDSHGNQNANSDDSRTAWKILIDGKLQVVGIGHHTKNANRYRAMFPFSDDPSIKDDYKPSNEITDART